MQRRPLSRHSASDASGVIPLPSALLALYGFPVGGNGPFKRAAGVLAVPPGQDAGDVATEGHQISSASGRWTIVILSGVTTKTKVPPRKIVSQAAVFAMA